MGKKDKKGKKGKGAEKTAAKTEKKLTAKQKKDLAAKGEDDIESILAQIEAEDRKRVEVVEHVVDPPSRRINFSLVAHPEKEELILFGGEYFNGQTTMLNNDMFVYNIPRNEWKILKAPAGAPPRSAHQMVAVAANKGQLWVFGGEYASPTQSQFYHYKDLWVYHIAAKKWEKINAPGGPSARSGHRMVCVRKHLVVFGGFHDNLRDCKYFNDVYAFDLENYTWKKIVPTGTPPAPRSACQMIPLADGKILVSGGYSKERVKKDVEKGTVHTDMFLLSPEKHDQTFLKWKWQPIKQGGMKPSPRCGMAITIGAANKAYAFGGVFDTEEDEENLAGVFFNDLYVLDTERTSWRTVTLSGKKDTAAPSRRRRKPKEGDDMDCEDDSEGSDNEAEMEVETPTVTTISDDGVFTVTVGPALTQATSSDSQETGTVANIFVPSPRSSCGLVVKHGVLYLFGGMKEDGDRQFTYNDFYSLDLHKLNEWKIIIPNDQSSEEWFASDSEEGSDDSEGSDSDSDSEDEDEDDMDVE
ncbi:kelch domain-containing protein 4 isoform X1 [Thrips palmi]|uniref:Kelch domain-containing protein 4 isoform X1 n=2 Tax=Thrips palmi TaxID=161013 RepID=A0A6P9A873_THRPL|nr:kelch domain-containing protein 4 isoform X1 [Thrips palmi]XP_034254188.1 kelch domain-containing protein 4 isoform X1 [Thrips palmi]XP_034254189.1 kelch domain-containing protein 4 isoform X1 [Thrips palmi]XP_034254190.1 kelch domain-containing protein 4 isoform X1 [Thrips palmi]XP_034254192.1 kelch domain-containing protein 4 isoform X1 [Thrips palmi]XP_034254193.1 kelch domain-containing protein 4 isoform X1 [Thrips palmi]